MMSAADPTGYPYNLLMAIATSIDALAAGQPCICTTDSSFDFNILSDLYDWYCYYLLCVVGAYLGRLFGCRLKRSRILGGAVS